MGLALKESGRDILFSACNWGSDHVETWIRSCGAGMYRSTGDINDNFNSVRDIAMSQIDKLAYSGTGCYNDIDMLIVGMYNRGNVKNGGCTDTDYKTHFAVWSVFGSPLMIGCDVRNINDVSLGLLKNKDLLRINQDEECRTAFVCGDNGNKGLCFFRHLSDNEYALMYVNFSDEEAEITLDLTKIGLWDGCGHGLEIKDVFTNEQSVIERTRTEKLAGHDSKVYLCRTISL
jgi:alpha-galactosidase